ncbi:hypothetical protein PILCRDRAFT_851 [Piloderma croceum F 1598]|uniref:Uncharacterized protein n=1 Tax=Piloderma croceum (strain F 1598) TaxID=765440 RepID=A0A0C3G681_PILCF|nr:hypothetical protein PILCRDRAFT_851 [Piloderma croceum F 1598]
MKSEGVDAWLKHWLKMQKKGSRPLVLKDGSNKPSEANVNTHPKIVDRRKGKKRYVEPDNDDEVDDGVLDAARANKKKGTDGLSLLKSPHSVGPISQSRLTFLASLSDDKHYKNLLSLLFAAKDGELLEGPRPAWVSWQSTDPYMSEAFFNPRSSSSLSALKRWIDTDPITADTGFLASYKQVELVTLGCGLAFRALWIAQFPDRYSDVPAHIIDSPYPFSEYEQLSHCIDDLLSGYAETIELIEAYYAHKPQLSKQGTSKDSVDEAKRNDAPDGNRGNGAPSKTGQDGSDGLGHRRQHGLSGVPPSVHYLREEVGLAGPAWETMGPQWQALGVLWLHAEQALSKSGRTDLLMGEVRKSDIPEQWKDWMYAKIMRTDALRPSETFRKVFTNYLRQLPPGSVDIGGTVMTNIWCRPGRTGIIGLLLCLYWQAKYSGAGKEWQSNIRYVEDILNAILAEPEL